jgi:hypothetical protein
VGEKGNPLDFLGELPVNMLSQLPDLAVAYNQWREKQESEAEAEAAAATQGEAPAEPPPPLP